MEEGKRQDVCGRLGLVPDARPLLSGVPSALHERWPVLLPKPVPVSPGLHRSLLPGARWRSWRGHRRLRPWAGPGRDPVHRRAVAPGSRERVCGQQARHLRGPGDRGSARARGGAPCPACSLPGAPRAGTDLSRRYRTTRQTRGGRSGRALGRWDLEEPRPLPSPNLHDYLWSGAALKPPCPAPSAGPAPRGERARPPSARGIGPSAPHRGAECRGPRPLAAPAAAPQAPAPPATHPEAPGPLLPGHTAQAARE